MIKPYVVMRRASLQEDEGHDAYVDSYITRDEAEYEIQNSLVDGYFHASDFYVVGPYDFPEYLWDYFCKQTTLPLREQLNLAFGMGRNFQNMLNAKNKT